MMLVEGGAEATAEATGSTGPEEGSDVGSSGGRDAPRIDSEAIAAIARASSREPLRPFWGVWVR